MNECLIWLAVFIFIMLDFSLLGATMLSSKISHQDTIEGEDL